MKPAADYDFIIAGGGLAGQVAAILLAGISDKVAVFEKKNFPEHKVCGEYLSNDILGILNECGFNPHDAGASSIRSVRLCSPSGKEGLYQNGNGGFGISRYTLDASLAEITKSKAALFMNTKVTAIRFEDDLFYVSTGDGKIFTAHYVIGAYGKRDVLDREMNRPFIKKHPNYLGVKYHIKSDFPEDQIGLYYFDRGYCGIVKIEKDLYNLCYLLHLPAGNSLSGLENFESKYLFKNPKLYKLFRNAEFSVSATKSIYQVYFGPKEQIKNHVIFCGDTAGMITPLCGNGMSMAIQGAKLLVTVVKNELVTSGSIRNLNRNKIEQEYMAGWQAAFHNRLAWGTLLQRLSENALISGSTLALFRLFPSLAGKVLAQTHGDIELPQMSV